MSVSSSPCSIAEHTTKKVQGLSVNEGLLLWLHLHTLSCRAWKHTGTVVSPVWPRTGDPLGSDFADKKTIAGAANVLLSCWGILNRLQQETDAKEGDKKTEEQCR